LVPLLLLVLLLVLLRELLPRLQQWPSREGSTCDISAGQQDGSKKLKLLYHQSSNPSHL
jgi:hypothetical protein